MTVVRLSVFRICQKWDGLGPTLVVALQAKEVYPFIVPLEGNAPSRLLTVTSDRNSQ